MGGRQLSHNVHTYAPKRKVRGHFGLIVGKFVFYFLLLVGRSDDGGDDDAMMGEERRTCSEIQTSSLGSFVARTN